MHKLILVLLLLLLILNFSLYEIYIEMKMAAYHFSDTSMRNINYVAFLISGILNISILKFLKIKWAIYTFFYLYIILFLSSLLAFAISLVYPDIFFLKELLNRIRIFFISPLAICIVFLFLKLSKR